MILDSIITKVDIKGYKNQTGNAFKKIWTSPVDFYVIGEYVRSHNIEDEWSDFYKFRCSIKNINGTTENISFINANERCGNPCVMRVLPNQSTNNVVFSARINTPGKYIAEINGVSTEFTVV